MRPVLTPEEAAALDALAEVDVGTLMERAGLALAISCSRRGVGYGDRVTVLCGPGNNGGDGYVLAKLLQKRGASPLVLALAEPRSRAAIEAAGAAAASGVRIGPWRAPGPLDEVVVDAIFGAGFRGPLPDDAVPWRGVGDLRLAVDLPSGLSGHTGQPMPVCLEADWTVTFHAPKRGHLLGIGPDAVGDLEEADIGLPDVEVGWGEAEDVDAEPAPRARSAHKWSVGGVVVLGGSPGMEGAPVLAARAAIAAGAGGALVARPGGLRAATPDGLLGASIGEATRLDASVVGEVLALAGRWEVLVVGPGMGPQAAGLVRHLVERWPGPGCTSPPPRASTGSTPGTETSPAWWTRRRSASRKALVRSTRWATSRWPVPGSSPRAIASSACTALPARARRRERPPSRRKARKRGRPGPPGPYHSPATVRPRSRTGGAAGPPGPYHSPATVPRRSRTGTRRRR